jgi:aminoglycoside/choline kinase family phosphotransferase
VDLVVSAVATGHVDLDPDWLSAALKTDVRSVATERIGTGQISSTYRLTIEAEGLPSTLVPKLAEGKLATLQRVATAHRNEVGFYTELAPTLEVRAPACWYGAISDDATRFTLILDDLAPRTPGRQVDGCSPDRADDSVRNLAALHASRWNDDSLYHLDFLMSLTPERAEFLGAMTITATEQFVARFETRLDESDVVTLREVAAAIKDWQVARPEPYSVVHGDYRLDNLLFPPVGDGVVAVDWQTVSVGLPTRDLVYFLGTSLHVDQRRATEERLVASYLDALTARGVKGYGPDRCFDDYRFGQLQGPMITVLGAMTATGERSPQADEMFIAMARRSCAAIRDLRSLQLL